MNAKRHNVTVQIARFTLNLSPLKRSELAPARKAWHRLAVAQFDSVGMKKVLAENSQYIAQLMRRELRKANAI